MMSAFCIIHDNIIFQMMVLLNYVVIVTVTFVILVVVLYWAVLRLWFVTRPVAVVVVTRRALFLVRVDPSVRLYWGWFVFQDLAYGNSAVFFKFLLE